MNKRLLIGLFIFVALSLSAMIFILKPKNSTEFSSEDVASYVKNLDQNSLLTKEDIKKAKIKASGKSLNEDTYKNVIPDHYMGNKNSKVTVIEYEDFACSHCQAMHIYFDKIQQDYKDRVTFIFRNSSLGYPNSIATLSAAEAAGKLGGEEAFWKMHKLLFKDQRWVGQAVDIKLKRQLFTDYAKESGLNAQEFLATLNNAKVNGIEEKIERDHKLAEKSGVTGTPTWFVNGKKVEKANDKEIRKAIEKALNK